MKNIYLIPTDKPSRLYSNKVNNKLLLEDISNPSLKKVLPSGSYQNIYITNDSNIKAGDWFLWKNKLFNFFKRTGLDCTVKIDLFDDHHHAEQFGEKDTYIEVFKEDCKKIILTTDPDLIADGVQSIDDEFLQWFVKNPGFERVDIQDWVNYYKVFIPQEEPKQIQLDCPYDFTSRCTMGRCDCKPKSNVDKVVTIKNNVQEFYCSYEVSKLLQEKGFNVETREYLDKNGVFFFSNYFRDNISIDDKKAGFITTCSHALAIEWIRVNFGNDIESRGVRYAGDTHSSYYQSYIDGCIMSMTRYQSPAEATEAALLHTLKNLIP